MLLVATADMPDSDSTTIVTPTTLAFLFQQGAMGRALMQIRVNNADYKSATRRGVFF